MSPLNVVRRNAVQRSGAGATRFIPALMLAALGATGCMYEDSIGPVPDYSAYDLLVEESDPVLNRVSLVVRDFQSGVARAPFGVPLDGAMPSASADGSFIVYISQATGTSEYDFQDLWRVRRGGQPQRITLSEGPETSPSISPDGTRMAYIKLNTLGEGRLYIANVDGTGERLVSPAMAPGLNMRFASPSWSPDGTRVLFSAGEPGLLDLYTARGDGTLLQQLTNATVSDIDGAWSPDGRSVALIRTPTPASSQLVIRDLVSGTERIFAYAYRNRHPAWSPDGTRIAFVSNMQDNLDLELYTVRADGGDLRRHTADDLRQQSPRWLRR